MGPAIRKVPLFPTRYQGVSVSRETWVMLCEGNLLRLQSCFLVVESFSMFHVKHDVSTTIQLFHVKRWLFLLWVGVVFWVLVFLVGGGCFT